MRIMEQQEKTEQALSAKEIKKEEKRKRKKAPVIIAVIIIVLIIIRLVSCAFSGNGGVMVSTTNAFRGDIEENVSTSGKVASEEKEILFAPVSGRLSVINVAAGDAVKAGDVLMTYDMEQMEERLQEATLQQTKSSASYNSTMTENSKSQAKLNEANTNLAVLDKQLADYKAYLKELQDKLSKSQRETQRQLSEESYELSRKSANLSKELQDSATSADRAKEINKELQDISASQARNSYVQSIAGSSDYVVNMQNEIASVQEHIEECETYKAKMQAQKDAGEGSILNGYQSQGYAADRDLAQLTYKEAEEQYYSAKKGIVADFDGIVTECTGVSGASVAEGTQLITLESSENVKVTFDASKSDVAKLSIGQKVDVTISGNKYGEISKINRMATLNASNTPMVVVEVHLTNPDDKIILGLDAKLTVHTNSAQNTLLIPVEAINADKNGDFLYVIENGMVVKRAITCGISSDEYTEVLDGITEEDQIIVNSLTGVSLEEGMAVTAVPMEQ